MKGKNRQLHAVAVIVSALLMIMLMTVPVLAGGGAGVDLDAIITGANSDRTVNKGATLKVKMSDLDGQMNGFKNAYHNGAEDETDVYWEVNGVRTDPVYDGTFFSIKADGAAGTTYVLYTDSVHNYDTGWNNNSATYTIKTGSGPGAPGSIDITINSSGIAAVTGKTTGSADFKRLWVDTFTSVMPLSGKSFSVTFDTKKYDIGYHTLEAELTDGSTIMFPKMFPTAIYDKPALSAGYFETNPKELAFTTPNHNGSKYDYYLQIKKGNGAWGDLYGPFSPVTKRAIKNLSPNTSYSFRAIYFKTTKGGYVFKSGFSNTVTVKTGPKKKPKVKSITISKGRVKKVWVKPILNAFGLVVKPGFYAYKTTYKVTVRFKKKPGVAGIYIHASTDTPLYTFVKGNKKTYSATFESGGKLIGKKLKVSVYTRGSKTFGAYSPVYKKKVKIRK